MASLCGLQGQQRVEREQIEQLQAKISQIGHTAASGVDETQSGRDGAAHPEEQHQQQSAHVAAGPAVADENAIAKTKGLKAAMKAYKAKKDTTSTEDGSAAAEAKQRGGAHVKNRTDP